MRFALHWVRKVNKDSVANRPQPWATVEYCVDESAAVGSNIRVAAMMATDLDRWLDSRLPSAEASFLVRMTSG